MNDEARLELYRCEVARLLDGAKPNDYLTFQLEGDPDAYVQYMVHDGVLYGEVGSRQ